MQVSDHMKQGVAVEVLLSFIHQNNKKRRGLGSKGNASLVSSPDYRGTLRGRLVDAVLVH